MDERQQWVNGYVVSDYHHATQKNCRMFLAYAPKATHGKPSVYVPYLSLLTHSGDAVLTAENIRLIECFYH